MADLLFALLLALSAFCLGVGLGMAYRESQAVLPADPEPRDEELLIFDRVTTALSALPPIEDQQALQAAEAEVMQRVGDRYGLVPADVEAIYRKVWRWRYRRR